MLIIKSILLRSFIRSDSKLIKQSIYISSKRLSSHLGDECESDSEKWLKYASDTESDPLGGNISTFEDEDGNLIRPTGELTKSMALRKLKRKTIHDRVKKC